MSSHVYLLLTLAFYSLAAFTVLLQAVIGKRRLTSLAVTAAFAGFAAHTAGISQRWTEAGRLPVVGLHDGSSFVAWAIVLAFLATYLRTRVDALGLAAYPAAFTLVLVANLTPASEGSRPILKGFFFAIHTCFALLGYGPLFLAFAMGVLYLIQERELKARSPRRLYYLLPSLERCDTITGKSVAVGFSFLTLAIITGLLWSHSVYGTYWRADPKEWSALIAWILYVVLLVARQRAGWGGRRGAWLGIAGFLTVVFTFFWATLVSSVAVAAVR